MTRKKKMTAPLVLAGLVTLPMLASCGLRGGLTRPAPIFKEAPAVVEEPTVAEPVRESIVIRPKVNEFGGELPAPAPTEPVGSTPLTDPVAPDDDEDEQG